MGNIDQFVNQFLVQAFGYNSAVVIKNLFIGTIMFLAGFYVASLIHAYLASRLKFDKDGVLLGEDIVMLILERKVGRRTKTHIMFPEGLSTFEHMLNHTIVILFKLRVIKDARVTRKDQRKARIVFFILLTIFTILSVITLDLAFSMLPYLD